MHAGIQKYMYTDTMYQLKKLFPLTSELCNLLLDMNLKISYGVTRTFKQATVKLNTKHPSNDIQSIFGGYIVIAIFVKSR